MPAPQNNGFKVFTLLVEYSTKTGHPTGRVKQNIPSDPQYIAPVVDHGACPIPGDPVFNHYNVDVEVAAGYLCTVQLWYSGTFHIDQTNTNTTWNIVDRPYDQVIFVVSTVPSGSPSYTVRITYQSGVVKTTNVTGVNSTVIPGPFTAITKIELVNTTGDYNDDYSDDFYN